MKTRGNLTFFRNKEGCPTIYAAFIAAAPKVEHYEMTTDGNLQDGFGLVGNQTAADFLHEILDKEKAADQVLTEPTRTCGPRSVEGSKLKDFELSIVPQLSRGVRPERVGARAP